jgi:hypothetical protein
VCVCELVDTLRGEVEIVSSVGRMVVYGVHCVQRDGLGHKLEGQMIVDNARIEVGTMRRGDEDT